MAPTEKVPSTARTAFLRFMLFPAFPISFHRRGVGLGVREHALEKPLELAGFGLGEALEEFVGDADGGGERPGVELAALGRELELDGAPVLGAAHAAHQPALLE